AVVPAGPTDRKGPRVKVAGRAAVPPFQVMSILDRVAQLSAAGREVISLWAGEPEGGAPPDVAAAAIEAQRAGDLGYTSALGPRELREAVAGHYRRWYSLEDRKSTRLNSSQVSISYAVFCLTKKTERCTKEDCIDTDECSHWTAR